MSSSLVLNGFSLLLLGSLVGHQTRLRLGQELHRLLLGGHVGQVLGSLPFTVSLVTVGPGLAEDQDTLPVAVPGAEDQHSDGVSGLTWQHSGGESTPPHPGC